MSVSTISPTALADLCRAKPDRLSRGPTRGHSSPRVGSDGISATQNGGGYKTSCSFIQMDVRCDCAELLSIGEKLVVGLEGNANGGDVKV